MFSFVADWIRLRRRRWQVMFGLLFGVCVAPLSAGWYLCRPAPISVGPAPSTIPAEDVAIAHHDRRVKGWFVPGRPGAGAVLLLHPLRGNRSTMLSRALFLHLDGRAVLLVDLQAHGETEGRRLTFGARESEDAQAALRYLRSRVPNERLAVIGWSLGGAAALLADPPLRVDALVLEAVYPTIVEAVANRLRVRLGALGGSSITPLLTSQLKLWTGTSVRALRPIDKIDRVLSPILIISGERDRRTTLDESQRLFAKASEPKSFWAVTGAGHEDFHATHREEYERRVGEFLSRYLGAGRGNQ